MVALLTIM